MLAADLQYPPNPLVTDITLQAVQNASPPILQLMQTGTGNQLASVTLDEASDNHIRISRSDLPELFGDRLRISLGSLTTLQTFVVNSGGSLTLEFDGGLETPLTEDTVWLEGSGQYTLGFGLEVRSTSDVQIVAGSPTISGNLVVDSENAVVVSNTQLTAANISLLATPSSTGTGDASDPQKVLSLPSAAITMTSGSLTAANITLAATATTDIQIQSESILGGTVSNWRSGRAVGCRCRNRRSRIDIG
jgi:hypothetical protein